MAMRKLKPIEERDQYAASVLDAFDRLEIDTFNEWWTDNDLCSSDTLNRSACRVLWDDAVNSKKPTLKCDHGTLDGYVLVPKIVTKEMMAAMCGAMTNGALYQTIWDEAIKAANVI